jgi:hypothetical protein
VTDEVPSGGKISNGGIEWKSPHRKKSACYALPAGSRCLVACSDSVTSTDITINAFFGDARNLMLRDISSPGEAWKHEIL